MHCELVALVQVTVERQPATAVHGVQPLPFKNVPEGHGVLVAVGVSVGVGVGVSVAVGVAVGIGTHIEGRPFEDSMYPAWQAVHCESVALSQVIREAQKGTAGHTTHVSALPKLPTWR